MNQTRRCLSVLLLALAPLAGWAQGYPARPVKIVNPYAPGGPVDLIARELAGGLAKALGGSFVIEYKPGANATLATSYVATAPPDGYTLLVGAGGANIAVPALSTKPPYDGIKEFAPVVMAVSVPNILVAGPHVQAATLPQFLEQARTPGRKPFSFASTGNGGSPHVAGEILKQKAKIPMTHVPYKGAAPIINDLLGGHVDVAFLNLSAVMSHIKTGKLRPLAIASRQRSKVVPEVPTFTELGIPDFFSGSWNGLLAPAGTPPEVVQAIYAASAAHLSQPEVRARLEATGTDVFLLDPPKFLAFMQEEKRDLVKIIKDAGITMDQ